MICKFSFYRMAMVLTLIVSANLVIAQDPHFSQYFTSPLTMNPALTGEGVKDWRVAANYRSQWWGSYVAPFTTTTLSFEKVIPSKKSENNFLSVGGYLLSDASNNGLLKNTYVSLDVSYHLSLDAEGDEQLSGGLAAAYANRLLDADKFSFQSQFGSMGFQRSIPSGESINILSNKYVDVNAGLNYSKQNDHWGYHAGVALFHAGGPSEGVYNGNQYSLPRRWNFSGGTFFNMSNDNVLYFSSVYEKQGSNGIFTLGSQYKIAVRNNQTLNSFNLGIWSRFGDAVYPYVGLEGKNWLAGISYDMVTSSVATVSSSVQSMEFSLIWNFGSGGRSVKKEGVNIVY